MIVFNIKRIREKQNISIRKLSQLTGLSRTYLSNLENNKRVNPTLSSLSAISSVLNVDVKELFYSDIELDKLKEEMYDRIDKYGINSKEALEVSQIIDLLINIDMRKL
jgi:transcriptional regulator with XRE-family HTH domain|nr:MAG TPA: Helix-turn-helix XRE-family like protein [Caudoviricetes sp.]